MSRAPPEPVGLASRPPAPLPPSALAALLVATTAMFATMYAPQAVLPDIAETLDVAPAVAGLTISVTVLGVAAGSWVAGPLSDRIGRRRVLLGAGIALVLPTAALIAPLGLVPLLVVRALQGLLLPGLLSVVPALLHDRLPPARRGTAMGLYTASLVAGGLIGRLLPAFFESGVGWRVGMAAPAVPLVLALPVLARFVAAEPPPPPRSRRPPATPRRAVVGPSLLLAAFAPALVMIAYAVAFSALPFRLRAEPFDLDAHAVGLVYGIWLIGLLAPMTGRLAHRLGPARLLPLLVVLAAVGVGLTLPDRLPLIVVGLTLLALSLFGAITAAQLLVPRLVPEATGAAMGVYVSVYYLGGSGGGVLAGLAWQHGGWPTVVAVCATALAGAAVAALALRRRLARA